MRKYAYIFLFCFLVCSCWAQETVKKSPFNTAKMSWTGTGWALKDGYVVTNHHVAYGARTLRLYSTQGDSTYCYHARIIAMDEDNDLALLRIIEPLPQKMQRPPYSVRTEQAEVGEAVWVMGYPKPMYMGNEIKLTNGILSCLSGFKGMTNTYQISAPLQPGNSGGPLLDAEGRVIGIVNSSYTQGENVNYAIKSKHLADLLERTIPWRNIMPKSPACRGKKLHRQARLIKPYVYYIFASSAVLDDKGAVVKEPESAQENSSKRVIESPYVDKSSSTTHALKIQRVVLSDEETVVEMICMSEDIQGMYTFLSLSPDISLEVGDKHYPLVRAEGIALAPEKTLISAQQGNQVFRMVFPPISQRTTVFNIVEPESNGWRFYGITLK